MTHISDQQMSAWLDRQLEAAKAAELEAHLRQCESCRCVQEELASTTGMFRNLEPLKAPAYLWTRVAAELEHSPKRDPVCMVAMAGIMALGQA